MLLSIDKFRMKYIVLQNWTSEIAVPLLSKSLCAQKGSSIVIFQDCFRCS